MAKKSQSLLMVLILILIVVVVVVATQMMPVKVVAPGPTTSDANSNASMTIKPGETTADANASMSITPDGTKPGADVATISGEGTCLPHKDTSGPTTMECAFGIKVDDGSFYAVNLEKLGPNAPMQFETGKKMKVTGVVTAAEALPKDSRMLIYDIKGTIDVTKIE